MSRAETGVAPDAIQTTLSELAERFLEVQPETIDAEIERALGQVAGLVGADGAFLTTLPADGSTLHRTHAWHDPAVGPAALPSAWSVDPLRPVAHLLSGQGAVILPDPDVPALAADLQADLDAAGVRALAVLPIRAERGVVGGIELLWRATDHGVSRDDLRSNALVARDLGAVVRARRAEHETQSSHRQLLRLTSAIPGVVYQIRFAADGTLSFPFFSAASIDLFGVPADQVERDPQTAFARVLPEDLPGLLGAIDEVLRNPGPWGREVRIAHPDGRTLWVQIRSILEPPLADGSLVWNGLITDVTERRRLEEQLSIAERMSSMGTLAAGVAHEINNPLAYVSGNLSYALSALTRLREGSSSPAEWDDFTEALQEALEGAHRVRDTVGDLKAFSRVDAPRRGPVEIRRVADLAIRMCRNELRHRARLVQELGDCPIVVGDESRLAEVLVNLLVNAAQAMPEGDHDRNEVRIVTRLDDGHVLIEVHDNGPGIAPESLARVFEPFFTTKPVGIGTGLGLPICRRIVEDHGGTLTLQSTLGIGTVARVSLRVGGPESTG